MLWFSLVDGGGITPSLYPAEEDSNPTRNPNLNLNPYLDRLGLGLGLRVGSEKTGYPQNSRFYIRYSQTCRFSAMMLIVNLEEMKICFSGSIAGSP
jgi:hypothetical protein